MRGEQSRIGIFGGAFASIAARASVVSLLTACGGGNAQEMASMRDELARVQHEADVLQDRVVHLEDREVGIHASERDIDGASAARFNALLGKLLADMRRAIL